MNRRLLLNLVMVISLLWPPLFAGVTAAPVQAHFQKNYGQLPLTFIPNHGQVADPVVYYVQGVGPSVWFTAQGVMMQNSQIELQFVSANPAPEMTAGNELPGVINCFVGNEPTNWHTNIPTYGQITYQDLWPGINLTYEGQPGILKSTFTVAPGADPAHIRLAYPAADSLGLDQQGNLIIRVGDVEIQESAPIAWQPVPNRQNVISNKPVPASYKLLDSHTYTFALPAGYDPTYPLVIDPELIYSTFLGTEDRESGEAIAIDGEGNAYVLINNQAQGLSDTDTIVVKVNADGSNIAYTTFLGGDNWDSGFGIAVDQTGNSVYVTGDTSSSNFPVPNALDNTLGGSSDAFVVKIDASDGSVDYGTFLGGSDSDGGHAIDIDDLGNIYVGGSTFSSDFPFTAGAFDITLNGFADAFVIKLNASGAAIDYATYLGGSKDENVSSLVIDNAGNAYVTGATDSFDFPTTPGVFDNVCGFDGNCDDDGWNPKYDGFVAKLNASGSALEYATFIGGRDYDQGFALAIDESGSTYITGSTLSFDFPFTPGAFDPGYHSGICGTPPYEQPCEDAFVLKLNTDATDVLYATSLGGSQADFAGGIAVDETNNAYVVGATNSFDFPTTPDALQPNLGGNMCQQSWNPQPCLDAFVAKLDATGAYLTYATLFGGDNEDDYGRTLVLDAARNVYFTGGALSSDFPTTPGAYDTTFDASLCGTPPDTWLCGDAFAAKLAIKDLSLIKSGPLTATVGSPITYTLTVANNTGITLTNVIITDTIPAGASYVEGGARTGNVVSWTIPSLVDGVVTQTNFVVTATQTITNNDYRVSASDGYSATGFISVTTQIEDIPVTGLDVINDSPTVLGHITTLTATIATGSNVTYTWAFGDGITCSGAVVTHLYPTVGVYTAVVTASNTSNVVTATTTVTITGVPNLAVSKAAPLTATAGAPITYTLTITNSGTATATNLVLTDTIPTGATYVTGGTRIGNVVSWTIPSLAANGGVTQTTFIVTATQTISNSDYRVSASGGYSATGNVIVVTTVNAESPGMETGFLPIILKE